ncbi:MAG: hypothetical protein E8D45_05145 [Nitrospira sp.]|nr:MAG: hypothetical protein E8D45_05145 [Nitrospira sp.]
MNTLQATCAHMLPICLLTAAVVSLAEAEPYEVDPGINGVTVHGRVKLGAPLKDTVAVPVFRDSEFCGDTTLSDAPSVDPATNGLSGVVLSIQGIEKGKPLTPSDSPVTIEIESKACRFSPHLTTTLVGASLEIRNLDPILHNLHVRKDTRYGPTVMNVIQPAGTRSVQKPFGEAGFLDVRCDVHPFMGAFIHVFEHPYYAITDNTGQFSMTKVPPGVYKVSLWHEQFGFREKTVKVPPGESLSLDFELTKEAHPMVGKPAR